MTITKKHRTNLTKLATYLEALPANYKHFDMSDFLDVDGHSEGPTGANHIVVTHCATSACAVGHGPNAGIKVLASDEDWFDYTFRAFGVDGVSEDRAWGYLFSPGWQQRDNTPAGAAARIHTYLTSGVPDDFAE